MPLDRDSFSHAVIGAAINVHRAIGPGLLESVYSMCLAHEVRRLGLEVVTEVPVPVTFEGMTFDAGFRADLIVERYLVVELKAVSKLLPVHGAQLRTYLRFSGRPVGLLINFNVPVLKEGITRMVHGL